MTNLTDNCVHTTDPDPSGIQHHRFQGDLVRQGFERPIRKIHYGRWYTRSFQLELKPNLLPLIRQQLTALSDPLELSGLRNQPGPRLRLILDIQMALELPQIEFNPRYTLFVQNDWTLCLIKPMMNTMGTPKSLG
ncbi:hypothetical protein H4Q26_009060 [Puccinia striiformis f. sp. tritici PST-130]|nr:hypothetical protein H4Q26_009060 [Puccinia striiformis f. sp. tritici PST-130]